MAVVVYMQWPEVTREHYETIKADVDWVTNKPPGAYLHVAGWHDEQGFRVIDLWESPDEFQAFVESRLTPSVVKAGLTTQPTVQIYPTTHIEQFKELPS